MDRNIYKYFASELLKSPDISFKLLPIAVVQKPWEEKRDCNANLTYILKTINEKIENQSSTFLIVPKILSSTNSPLFTIFKKCHIALLDVIQGADPEKHAFKSNGIQLLSFLTVCAQNGIDPGLCNYDCSSLAMACFLMEGLMFCGWSVDSFEGQAKRSAHEYCITLKKSLYRLHSMEKSIVLGYLWATWVLAKKTEGIQVAGSALPVSQKIEFHIDGFSYFYSIEKNAKSPVFFMLSYSHNTIPHPFASFLHDGLLGLSITINSEMVNPKKLISLETISRIKKHGYLFRHECSAGSIENIVRTTVILIFESTVYRIDTINVPAQVPEISMRAALHIEIPYFFSIASKRDATAKAPLVEFIENPLDFEFERIIDSGIAMYSSKTLALSPASPIRMTTAWSFSPNAAAIDRTHLLGIYD